MCTAKAIFSCDLAMSISVRGSISRNTKIDSTELSRKSNYLYKRKLNLPNRLKTRYRITGNEIMFLTAEKIENDSSLFLE